LQGAPTYSLGDARAIATALCTCGDIEVELGRATAGMAAAEEAIRVAQAADQDVVWAVKLFLWALVESPTPVPEADRLVAGLLGDLGMRPAVRSQLVQAQALLAVLRGDGEAWRLLETAHEIERDLGRSSSSSLRMTRARMHLLAGDHDAVRRMLPSMVAEFERDGAESNAAVMRSWLGLAEACTGDLAAARASATAALAGTTYGGGYEGGVRAHLTLAEVHIGDGDAEGAVAAARTGLAIAERGDWVFLRASARLVLARALAASGDAAAAAREAQAARDLSRAKGHAAGTAAAETFLRSLVAAPG
jgi:hypothetical protein